MDQIGRYQIMGELGRGAMGVVYHAVDPNIGRPVAIKTIQLGGKPEDRNRMRERLFREARSAGALSHPGIVTIYDVEQQGDLAYIAMEFVDGTNLDRLMEPGQGMTPERMFDILGQAAAALDYAHQKGIVHRDIKPANIMIGKDGVVKIADFGIAKVTAAEQFTMTGTIVGTPHYMSPEQVQGQQVDGRSDQFSLAVVAFELLTGDKPYTGEHMTTVVYKIVAEEPAPALRLNPKLTPAIDAVLRRALAKKPDARFKNCRDFVTALEKACAGAGDWQPVSRGAEAEEAASGARPNLPPPRHPRLTRTESEEEEEKPRKKGGFAAFLIGTLAVAAVLAIIGWQAGPNLPFKLFKGDAPRKVESPEVGKSAPPATPAQSASAQPVEEEPKPSPMPKAPATAAPSAVSEDEPDAQRAGEPVRTTPTRTAQPVLVISSPAGASAVLDSRRDIACSTPCSLAAAPGRHIISISMQGYETEQRDVLVGSAPVELPPVVLKAPSGTLMLTTAPDGASVSVNGKKLPQTTPAQIPLTPGNYKITVEKDGRQITSPVEIRAGAISYLRILLN